MTHRVTPLLACLVAAVATWPGCEDPVGQTPDDTPGAGGTGDPVADPGDDQPDDQHDDWTLTTVSQEPEFTATAETTTLGVDGSITVVAARGADVLVGTTEGLFRVASGELELVEVYVDAADVPDATGAVTAITALPDGEALVIAANGVFHTYEHVLLVSPLSDVLAGLDIRAVSVPSPGETGDDETWVATADGLLRVTGDALESFTLAGTSNSPTAVAALTDVVLVVDDGDLYQLDRADFTVLGSPLSAADAPERLAAVAGQGFVTTSSGIVQRQDAATWYTHAVGTVASLAPSADDTLLAATAAGLLSVAVTASEPATVTPVTDWSSPDASAGLSADIDGNVWVGGTSELTQVLVGSPLSFAADVEPLLAAQCAYCHDAGLVAPARDFTDYDVVVAMADTILERVSLGLMPPAPTTMSTADIDVLIRWYEGGMNP